MKEHFQDYGIRKWAGNDLIELQSEPLEALQKLVEPYAPCIIQGCEVTENDGDTITIEPGLVALQGKDYKGEDCVKIARFAGIADTIHPVYFILECEPESRVYGDSKSKAIAYHYRAVATTQDPEGPYLKITASGNKRLIDTLGITQKLDREGGNASDVKVMFGEESAEELESGNTLAKLFGGIKKWLDRKVDKIPDKGLSAEDYTKEEKQKLKDIAEKANKYTLPTASTNALGGIKTGYTTSGKSYKVSVDGNGNAYVNVPWTDNNTTYGVATQSVAGLMSKDDKTKLDGIASGAQVNPAYAKYTGDPFMPMDTNGYYTAESCVSNSYGGSAGTADTVARGDHKHSVYIAPATTTQNGLMSAADKKKIDGVAAGANNYTLPQATSSVLGGIKIMADAYNKSPDDRIKIPLKGSASAPVVIADEIIDCSNKLIGTITANRTIDPGNTLIVNAANITLIIGTVTELKCRTGVRVYMYQSNVLFKVNVSNAPEVLASNAAKEQMTRSGNIITIKKAMGFWTITWLSAGCIWVDFDTLGSVVSA